MPGYIVSIMGIGRRTPNPFSNGKAFCALSSAARLAEIVKKQCGVITVPDCEGSTNRTARRGRGWKYMESWGRKQFHRENDSRVRRGLKALPKPESKPITDGV
jgi:hypothetical protein